MRVPIFGDQLIMARYKVIDTSPRFLAVDLRQQLVAGTFEHALDLKISQEALAESAGISRNYVSRVESASADLSLVVFARLATAFGMRPWEFLRDAELALPIRKSVKARKPKPTSNATDKLSTKRTVANKNKTG